MDRVDTRSGNKEGGAPEMVESNPTPTIPDHTNPCPYGSGCRHLSQPVPQPQPPASSGGPRKAGVITSTPRRGGPKGSVGVRAARVSSDSGGGNNNCKEEAAAVASSRKQQPSQPAPPVASSGRRIKAAVVTSTHSGGCKGSLGVGAAVDVSSDSGGNKNSKEKAAATSPRRGGKVTSSRRGGKWQPRAQTEEERDAQLRAILKHEQKRALDYFPTYLADMAREPAQLAIEYYKNKVGVQLQLTEMIHASTEKTSIGFISHLQLNAMPLSPSGPPTTVYAQIHERGPYPHMKDAHASRVFTHESPLLKDPRFKVHPTKKWIEYPFDCPECGLDFLDGRDGFKGLPLMKLMLV